MAAIAPALHTVFQNTGDLERNRPVCTKITKVTIVAAAAFLWLGMVIRAFGLPWGQSFAISALIIGGTGVSGFSIYKLFEFCCCRKDQSIPNGEGERLLK